MAWHGGGVVAWWEAVMQASKGKQSTGVRSAHLPSHTWTLANKLMEFIAINIFFSFFSSCMRPRMRFFILLHWTFYIINLTLAFLLTTSSAPCVIHCTQHVLVKECLAPVSSSPLVSIESTLQGASITRSCLHTFKISASPDSALRCAL